MGMVLSEIIIRTEMDDEGEVSISFEFGDGNVPNLVQTLGTLELAKDTAIRIFSEAMDAGDAEV